MAHFLIKHKNQRIKNQESFLFSCSKKIELSPNWEIHISGLDSTYEYYENSNSFIYSFGYACKAESHSMKDTLIEILFDFQQQKLGLLKKTLIGQFIIIIKKQATVFIFNDFLGGRNLFYDSINNLITSSFVWAEDSIGYKPDYLDDYKTLEYLAMREVKYPTWVGRKTMNKNISWLLPYEYIKLNLQEDKLEIKQIDFELDNKKDSNLDVLSENLIYKLSTIIERKEFINSTIGCSLTGGRDSRLVAILAANLYPDCRYRIAISKYKKNSLWDLKIAKRIAKIQGVNLDIFEFKPDDHEQTFRIITEELVPAFNNSITPLIINNHKYSLTFGGVYGSELFEPIFTDNIDKYIHYLTGRIKASIDSTGHFLYKFIESMQEQINEIKKYYHLQEEDEKDYIRIFQMLITARYSSFILSAMAQYGYDIEPYGSYPLVELSLKIHPSLWGNKKSLIGDATVQKAALYKISKKASRILAYSSFRPVMPFSPRSSLKYFAGYVLHIYSWINRKIGNKKQSKQKINLVNFRYTSEGWYKYYFNRIDKYKAIEVINK